MDQSSFIANEIAHHRQMLDRATWLVEFHQAEIDRLKEHDRFSNIQLVNTRLRPSAIKKGADVPSAKLDDDKVREIRKSTESMEILADRFGVSAGTIFQVRNHKTWKHVI